MTYRWDTWNQTHSNRHIGIGIPWDLDKNFGGVTILSPFLSKNNTAWYSGTANAVYQNIPFIDYYDPEYVLILSGDHIYKMDYQDMINYHQEKDADLTIAFIKVPSDVAHRFGVAKINDEDGEKGKDLLHKLFENGGELHKATGHGVGGDCERVLFYEINGDGEGGCSTVIEVRGWVQEGGARNTERIN